jgi:putative ABC transport system permease protein
MRGGCSSECSHLGIAHPDGLSYAVSLRRREVGLRLALGAARRDIISYVLFKAFRVVAVACVCGLVMSAAFTRILSGMLHGVSASDPIILASVIAIVLTVTALAALVPAIRAALVEPRTVLHES